MEEKFEQKEGLNPSDSQFVKVKRMQRSRVSHHPCHRLSVPSAKRFWCRHCMMVFEDAITRWRHSRSCRSAGFDNLVRRREIETQSLQKMAETLDPEMVTQITVPREDGTSKDLCCFICRQRFVSLDEMREHVKYPCNKPSSMQRAPLPLIYPEPTFGTGIQQHYTDGPVLQSCTGRQQGAPSASTSNSQAVTVYMNEGEQADADSEAKPTNIYVNENGETVIEVENLDLNTKSGELSLAHLLTQLSQQGIVFDQQPQGETEVMTTSPQEPQVVQESVSEVDYGQPTAVDAANTLTQLAGSAFRAVNSAQEAFIPPAKRIKTEQMELNYHQLEQPDHQPVQTYVQKEEPYVDNVSEKYIICSNESDVIRVMQANAVTSEVVEMPPEVVSSRIAFQNGESGANILQSALTEGEVEETILCQGQPEAHPQTAGLQEVIERAPAQQGLTGSQMIVLQHNQPQVAMAGPADAAQHLVKTEEHSNQIMIAEQNPQSTQVMIAEQNPQSSNQIMIEQNPQSANHIMMAEQNPQSSNQIMIEQNPQSANHIMIAEQNPQSANQIMIEQNPQSTQVMIAEENPALGQVVMTEEHPSSTQVIVAGQDSATTQVIMAENPTSSQMVITKETPQSSLVMTQQTLADGHVVLAEQNLASGQVIVGENPGCNQVVMSEENPGCSQVIVGENPGCSQVVMSEENPGCSQVVMSEENPGCSQVIVGENPGCSQVVMAQHNLPSTPVIAPGQNISSQAVAHPYSPSAQVVLAEQNPEPSQVLIGEQHHHNHPVVEQQQQQQPLGLEAAMSYAGGGESGVTMVEQVELGPDSTQGKHCVVMPTNSQEVATSAFSTESDSAVTGLLEMSGVIAPARHPQQAVVAEPEAALLLPQIVSVSSSAAPDGTPLVVQQEPVTE